MENKMNWGTLILGIVIGAVVVGVVWMASKPATTQGGEIGSPKNPGFISAECKQVNQIPLYQLTISVGPTISESPILIDAGTTMSLEQCNQAACRINQAGRPDPTSDIECLNF